MLFVDFGCVSSGTTPPTLGSYEYPNLPITKNRKEVNGHIQHMHSTAQSDGFKETTDPPEVLCLLGFFLVLKLLLCLQVTNALKLLLFVQNESR